MYVPVMALIGTRRDRATNVSVMILTSTSRHKAFGNIHVCACNNVNWYTKVKVLYME